jgi:hypothetical protein
VKRRDGLKTITSLVVLRANVNHLLHDFGILKVKKNCVWEVEEVLGRSWKLSGVELACHFVCRMKIGLLAKVLIK